MKLTLNAGWTGYLRAEMLTTDSGPDQTDGKRAGIIEISAEAGKTNPPRGSVAIPSSYLPYLPSSIRLLLLRHTTP